MITLEEMKTYLRVDGRDEDSLIEQMMNRAQTLCQDVARCESLEDSPALHLAILYATAYLYEHREEANHTTLLLSLRSLLMGERKAGF